MKGHGTKFSHKMEQAIVALLSQRNHEEAARVAGIGVATLLRWQKLPQLFRSGYLKTLPADYVGERHVVIVKREPAGATGQNEWCEFEERPGPAPLDAQEEDCTTIYIVYRDRLNPQGGRKRSTHDECAEAT